MKPKRIKVVRIKRKESTMPSTEKRQEIENVANKVIDKYGLNKPAFNLIQFLVKQQGFKVGVQDLDRNTKGLLLVNELEPITDTGCHQLIVINSILEQDPEYLQKRRFISAHEYGHYLLHKNGKEIYAHREAATREAPLEKEADYFALCLLMPRNLLSEVYDLWNLADATEDEKVSTVSRIFNVSKNKARLRLNEVFGTP